MAARAARSASSRSACAASKAIAARAATAALPAAGEPLPPEAAEPGPAVVALRPFRAVPPCAITGTTSCAARAISLLPHRTGGPPAASPAAGLAGLPRSCDGPGVACRATDRLAAAGPVRATRGLLERPHPAASGPLIVRRPLSAVNAETTTSCGVGQSRTTACCVSAGIRPMPRRLAAQPGGVKRGRSVNRPRRPLRAGPRTT